MEINSEDRIETFIRENRESFEMDGPPEEHSARFLYKLNYKLSHLISIVPYLVKVAVATILIFVASLVIWNNYLRKDRNEITFKEKVVMVVRSAFRKALT